MADQRHRMGKDPGEPCPEWLSSGEPCTFCEGSGTIAERHDWATELLACPDCQGTGKQPDWCDTHQTLYQWGGDCIGCTDDSERTI